MKFQKFISISSAILLLSLSWTAFAEKCNAEAEFLKAYPANDVPSKFKFKFRVESDDCVESSCMGFIQTKIHYQTAEGRSTWSEKQIRYRIKGGETSTEATDETYPGGPLYPIQINDVDVMEVSCSK